MLLKQQKSINIIAEIAAIQIALGNYMHSNSSTLSTRPITLEVIKHINGDSNKLPYTCFQHFNKQLIHGDLVFSMNTTPIPTDSSVCLSKTR